MASQFDAAANRRKLQQEQRQSRRLGAGHGESRFNESDEFHDPSDPDETDDDDEHEADPVDRIRRHYHTGHQAHTGNQAAAARQPSSTLSSGSQKQEHWAAHLPETIQVTLDEGYFAPERRLLVNALANARQKLSSLQLFNPAQNESAKQEQQEWSEKEKYTLDSLNEFKAGPLEDRFQWNKPDDGREVWPSKLQYFMAITSYSIGLGNVIRFPILVQKNGGLAFVIPFVIMLLLEGIPLFYLELAIGQRTRKAAISCWNLVSPFAAGIGLASAAVSFLIGLYYNTMVAWTLLYTWASLTGGLPAGGDGEQVAFGSACEAHTAGDDSPSNESTSMMMNGTTSESECRLASPFEFYWYRRTLDITASVSDWSHFNWPICLCLALAWAISYVCLVKGLSTSRRLVYVVSTFPYVILLIFFAKSLSLRGMEHGLVYLFAPDWPKLFDPYVWLQATAQVFFSLGLGFGGLIALSSYNPVNNNCYRDAVKVSLINFATSLLAGVVVFSILGFRANLKFEKCQVEREQQVDFYLADYNMKVLEYGAVFKQVAQQREEQRKQVRNPREEARTKQQQLSATEAAATTTGGDTTDRRQVDNIEQFMAVRQEEAKQQDDDDDGRTEKGMDGGQQGGEGNESSLDDAIDAISNLDRQLDLGSSSGSFDYGDSDTEFILNASSLIDREQLDKIIENIENLPKCSVRRELDQSTQGTGLVFVVMAEAISQFDSNSSTWAILFFLMILSLGFDSQFGNLEGLLSSLTDFNFNLNSSKQTQLMDDHHDHHHQHVDDQLPNGAGGAQAALQASQQQRAQQLQTNQLIRAWATGLICLLSFAISVVLFGHGAGSYMFAIFDEYASSFSLVLIALFELLAISYIYGLKTFCDDCELMTGKRPPFIVLLSWRYISPILLLILVLATIKQFTVELNYDVWNVLEDGADFADDSMSSSPPPHIEIKMWPTWSIVFGVLLIVSCVIWIPLIAVLKIMRVQLIPEEQHRRWFPVEELKDFHQLQDQEHQVTRLERILFGFKQDDD